MGLMDSLVDKQIDRWKDRLTIINRYKMFYQSNENLVESTET